MDPILFQRLTDDARFDRTRSSIRNPDNLRPECDADLPDPLSVLAVELATDLQETLRDRANRLRFQVRRTAPGWSSTLRRLAGLA